MTKKELDNLINMIHNDNIRSILSGGIKASDLYTDLAIERLVKEILELEKSSEGG